MDELDDPNSSAARPPRSRWMVRNRAGQIREFQDLATLHTWIAQGKLSPEDEISKMGQSWRPLSAIVELSALFTQTGHRIAPRIPEAQERPPVNRTLAGFGPLRPPTHQPISAASGLHRVHTGLSEIRDRPSLNELRPPSFGSSGTAVGMGRALPPPLPQAFSVVSVPQHRISQQPGPMALPGRAHPSAAAGPAHSMGPQPQRRPPPIDYEQAGVESVSAEFRRIHSIPPQPVHGGMALAGPEPLGPPSPTDSFTRQSGLFRPVDFGEEPSGSSRPLPFGAEHSFSSPSGGIPRSHVTGVHPVLGPRMELHDFGFEGEQRPGYSQPRSSSGLRGFAVGMLVSVALAGAGYFVYNEFFSQRAPEESGGGQPVAAGASVDSSLLVRLDRAQARLASSTQESLQEARQLGADVLDVLGENPAAPEIAQRAALVQAQVEIVSAEYARLEGGAVDLSRAEHLLAQARRLNAQNPGVELAFADLRRVQGDKAGARMALGQAQQLGAAASALSFQEATLGLHTGEAPAKIVQAMEALAAGEKGLPRARYLLAVAHQRAAQLAEAEGVLRALLAEQPDHGPAQRLLVSILQARDLAGNAPAAVQAEDDTAEAQPSAQVAAAPPSPPEAPPSAAPSAPASEPAAATPAVEEKAKPKPARAVSTRDLVLQGQRHLENGRTAQARQLFLQALDRGENTPELWSNLGWCELDVGRNQAALGHFNKALTRSDRFADARYGQGVAYEALGRTAEAIRAYERFLSQQPTGQKASIVRRKLENLKQ